MTPAATAHRFDIYAFVHKALRSFMTDTLGRVGSLDVFDDEETADVLAQLESLLVLCTQHIQHENEFVHRAIEARRPLDAYRTSDDHAGQHLSMRALRDDAHALRAAEGAARLPLAQRLYRDLALFVAENFEHMHVEETANNASLWAAYTDAELIALHDRLLASIPPEEHATMARWMVPALGPVERAGMLGQLREQAPREAFDILLESLRAHLDGRGWQKLMRDLQIAPIAPWFA